MPRFYNNKNNFKSSASKGKIYEEQVKDAGKPVYEEKISSKTTLLNGKTTKDLPRSSASIMVKQDPYSLVLPKSDPYALINRSNSKAGGSYGGLVNLDSSETSSMLIASTSNFLNVFDSLRVNGKVNYRMIPMVNVENSKYPITPGIGVTRQMIHAINDIKNILDITTFTNLDLNNYYIATDIPMPKEYAYNNDKNPAYNDGTYLWKCSSAAGLFQISIVYQTILQSVSAVFNAYNKMRGNQGNMQRMSFQREDCILNKLFGQYNKKGFVSLWQSLALAIKGEYFDADWMRQFNLINNIVSRKSDAMLDPLLEMSMRHNLPRFKIYATKPIINQEYKTIETLDYLRVDKGSSLYYNFIKDESDDKISTVEVISDKVIDNIVISNDINRFETTAYRVVTEDEATLKSFDELVSYACLRLSVNDILYWARRGTFDIAIDKAADTVALHVNTFKDITNCLVEIMTKFKTAFSDYKAVLQQLSGLGLCKWDNNLTFKVNDDLDIPALDNITVRDLFCTLLSGVGSIEWDNNTGRWSSSTMWHKYYGIPEYDNLSGGCFMAFCTKDIKLPKDNENETINSGTIINALEHLPIFITSLGSSSVDRDSGSHPVYAINRKGVSVGINYIDIKVSENSSLSRLLPFTSEKYKDVNLRVPTFRMKNQSNEYIEDIRELSNEQVTVNSFLQYALSNLCGMSTYGTDNKNYIDVDSNLLCILKYEVADFFQEIQNYADANAPITKSKATSKIGFLGFNDK